VLQSEIYATGVAAADNTVFGYQERWQEYRTRQSEVTGVLKSTTAGTLDAWHLAEKFTSAPLLNNTFITEKTGTILNRILAAGAAAQGQQFLSDIQIRRTAIRPIPTYGTPAILGRF
jgi:hypothetical protein